MIRFGSEVLADAPSLVRGGRIGLVTNDAARLACDPTSPVRRALRDAGVPIIRLFGPEHGLGATAPDGASVPDSHDPITGLPVVSLYGERMRPAPAMLEDLDAVLFDIPDVGARFYTYTWTLYHLLAACAESGTPVVVCDRPNPLGGLQSEGPILEPDCRSFIGEDAIPVRHGLTHGELACLWQRERYPRLDLTVIPCVGWSRAQAWPATGLPWVPTSPAMPTFASAIWYPGTCLFEATNCSVGRGTPWPFQVIGAPWLDAVRLCATLQALELPGLDVQPIVFTPTINPWANTACHGVRLSLAGATPDDPTDPQAAGHLVAQTIRPVLTGLLLLQAVMRQHPHDFAWAPYRTAANPSGAGHFARLVGDATLSERLALMHATDLLRCTTSPGWEERTTSLLLYD